MFVRQSKYDSLANQYFSLIRSNAQLNCDYGSLANKWSTLVRRINDLGGETFLLRGEAKHKQAQIAAEDVQRLLMLCHPDKHDGKQMATEMTAKLLKLKEQLK